VTAHRMIGAAEEGLEICNRWHITSRVTSGEFVTAKRRRLVAQTDFQPMLFLGNMFEATRVEPRLARLP
jgi:hypothetical protein